MNNLDNSKIIDYTFIQEEITEILEDIHGYNGVAGLFVDDDKIDVFYFCPSERSFVYDTVPLNQIVGDTETIKENIKLAKLLKDPEYQKYLKLKAKFEEQ